jgi:hypothetical protein
MRFLLLLSILLSQVAWSQDLEKAENQYLGYIYQQSQYELNDPKGDILLLWTARNIIKKVMSNLNNTEQKLNEFRDAKIAELVILYPQYAPKEEDKNLVVEDYITFNPNQEPIPLEGHKAPFTVRNLSLMMKQVITEEYQNGLIPKVGEIHDWSPEIKRKLRSKFPFFSRLSKLLIALARGVTSYYMVSGQEEELKNFILSRPENSISLEEMFRASYRINQGDVYLTILTIENVLSRFWTDKDREKRAITTRLKDITNYYYKTDKFGSWYHLFGIMLYGYAKGSLAAVTVGNIETMGSRIMSRFEDERQETYINSRGGRVGARIHRFIEKKAYEKFDLNEEYIKEEFYLNLNEDFSKRLKKKNPA